MDLGKPRFSRVRRRLLSALCTTPILLATGCEREDAPPAAKPGGEPIRLGAYYWPGSFWFDIAHRKGWFREAGLNVEWVDTNADYFGSFEQFVTGKLDILGFTQFDFLLYNAQGKPVTAFLASDYSNGADALVARPGILRVSDLAGRRLALSKGTYLEYIWTVAAQRAGLDPRAVKIIDTPGEKVQEPLVLGKAQAAVTWEPYASQALDAVKGSKLFDTSQIPGLLWSMICTRPDFLERRPADVQAFVGVWLRTTQFLRERQDEAYAIVAEVNKKSLAEVRDFATKVRVQDLRDNLTAFSFAGGYESLHGSSRQMNDFMISAGVTNKRLDTAELFDSRFVRALR